METNDLLFHKRHSSEFDCEQDVFTVTVAGSAYEYIETMKALLRTVKFTEKGLLTQGDIYSICSLIEEMLPTEEQMKIIEKFQKQQQ